MSKDSFIREVNEEIRQDKARALWGRYGPVVIGLAVLVVLATACFQFFQYWQNNKAGKIGDTFLLSLNLAQENKFDEALKLLDDVEKSDFGDYPFLAELRKASIYNEKGEPANAVKAFDAIAGNTKVPEELRKIAQVRAGYILVDNGTFDDVEKRVGSLAMGTDAMRLSAREALGLAAYKAGKTDVAKSYFEKNVDENLTGLAIIERSQLMLEMIRSLGQAAKG